MKNQELDIALFDRYLLHMLSEAELEAFNEKLLNDDDFNEAFNTYRTITTGIQDFGRAELKNYIRSNAEIPAGGRNFNINRMTFAIAAAIAIFAGLFIVFNYYTGKDNSPTIATIETIHNEQSDDTAHPLMNKTENASEQPAIAQTDNQQPVIEKIHDPDIMTEDSRAPLETGAMATSENIDDMDYKIVSEYKLSDTLLYAMNVDQQEAEMDKSLQNSPVQKEKYSRKSLPSPASNNNSKNETPTKSDTGAATIKKKDAIQSNPYQLEFWQSPINFKGYKLFDNTVQLYGLSKNNTRLYSYKNKIYLRNGNNIFILLPCIEGCLFKVETDQGITNLLLNQ